MKSPSVILLLCWLAAGAFAQEKPLPTWRDQIAKGVVPYRQLKVDDFAINDEAPGQNAFNIRTAIEPYYRYLLKPQHGFAYAYIQNWMVFSGLYKPDTHRRSAFKTMKAELPYAQAFLDLNEIAARRMAMLKTGELPNARAASYEEAQAELQKKMKQFCDDRYKEVQVEIQAFAKATMNGQDKKKVRELAAEIRKRLDATPAATVPFTPADAEATSTAPAASPTPAGVPQPDL